MQTVIMQTWRMPYATRPSGCSAVAPSNDGGNIAMAPFQSRKLNISATGPREHPDAQYSHSPTLAKNSLLPFKMK